MGAAPKINSVDLVERLNELPTLPSIVYELNQVINNPMSSTKDVEKIMQNDQAMTAKVLKLVNSAYYNVPGGVSSLARAISYIGFDTVNQLVLSTSIIGALKVKSDIQFDIKQFWIHSMGVGIASEVLAKNLRHSQPSDLFTAGLVHDLGKIAMLVLEPQGFMSICETAQSQDLSYFDAEAKLDFPRHTEVGRLLCDKWKLPSRLSAACRYHHTLEIEKRVGQVPETNQIIDIVLLANLLIHALKFGDSGHKKVVGAPKYLMERLNLNPNEEFKNLINEIKEQLGRAQDFIRVLGA